MSPALHRVVHAATDNGLPVTLAGSASATVFWGLHISDIAVIISAFAAVAGVALQFYVAMRRIHLLEAEMNKAKDETTKVKQTAAVAGVVATAAAVSNRQVADRVADLEKKIDP